MGEPSPTNNSTPPRVRIPQKRGKPLQVVADPENTPLIDGKFFLAWQKTDGRFFIGRTKPRVYVGRDYDAARYRFRDFVRGKSEDPTVWGQMIKGRLAVLDVPEDPKRDRLFHSVVVPILDFHQPETLRCIRRFILSNPAEAARRLEIPELARLTSLPPVLPSVPLNEVYDAYVGKRKRPSPKELAAVKRYWNAFVAAVSPAQTVADVTGDRVRGWVDSAFTPLNAGGSPKMVHHRIEYVRRVFAYAARQEVDSAECQRVLKEIRKIELPDTAGADPRPINRQHFEKLLRLPTSGGGRSSCSRSTARSIPWMCGQYPSPRLTWRPARSCSSEPRRKLRGSPCCGRGRSKRCGRISGPSRTIRSRCSSHSTARRTRRRA